MWGGAKRLISQPFVSARSLWSVWCVRARSHRRGLNINCRQSSQLEAPSARASRFTVSCGQIIRSLLSQQRKQHFHCYPIWGMQFSMDLTVSTTKHHMWRVSPCWNVLSTYRLRCLVFTLYADCLLKYMHWWMFSKSLHDELKFNNLDACWQQCKWLSLLFAWGWKWPHKDDQSVQSKMITL